MAQLNSELAQFTAATAAATLSAGQKLIRNFNYYRSASSDEDLITREELLLICNNIRMDLFGMHNLLNDELMQHSPFLVSLACRINDSYEELHRKLLFFDIQFIENIIPQMDTVRHFWADCTEPFFYNSLLEYELEHGQSEAIKQTEKAIKKLPESISF